MCFCKLNSFSFLSICLFGFHFFIWYFEIVVFQPKPILYTFLIYLCLFFCITLFQLYFKYWKLCLIILVSVKNNTTPISRSVCLGGMARPPLMLMPFTGTLTQNEMVFRRLHLGTVAYGMDSMDEVQSHVFSAYTQVFPRIPCMETEHACIQFLCLIHVHPVFGQSITMHM